MLQQWEPHARSNPNGLIPVPVFSHVLSRGSPVPKLTNNGSVFIQLFQAEPLPNMFYCGSGLYMTDVLNMEFSNLSAIVSGCFFWHHHTFLSIKVLRWYWKLNQPDCVCLCEYFHCEIRHVESKSDRLDNPLLLTQQQTWRNHCSPVYCTSASFVSSSQILFNPAINNFLQKLITKTVSKQLLFYSSSSYRTILLHIWTCVSVSIWI